MAPVKMRAALAGSKAWPTTPAGMRWLTGNKASPEAASAARTA